MYILRLMIKKTSNTNTFLSLIQIITLFSDDELHFVMDLLDLVGVVSLLLIRWCILYTFTLGISPRLLAMVFERFMPLLFETIRIDSLGRLILVLEVQELIGLSAEFVRN